MARELTIGELSARSGVSQSALRFYEREGLISARRTDGNQRRYATVTLRRVALLQAGKAAGIPLERIRTALEALPAGKTPTKRDWERLSRSWQPDAGNSADGELVYRRAGCVACHAIGGVGGNFGPDFSSIGASAPPPSSN